MKIRVLELNDNVSREIHLNYFALSLFPRLLILKLMKIKSFLAKPYASVVHKRIQKSMQTAVADQQHILQQLLKSGCRTTFGNDHNLKQVKQYQEYKEAVPIRDYEAISPYIE